MWGSFLFCGLVSETISLQVSDLLHLSKVYRNDHGCFGNNISWNLLKTLSRDSWRMSFETRISHPQVSPRKQINLVQPLH